MLFITSAITSAILLASCCPQPIVVYTTISHSAPHSSPHCSSRAAFHCSSQCSSLLLTVFLTAPHGAPHCSSRCSKQLPACLRECHHVVQNQYVTLLCCVKTKLASVVAARAVHQSPDVFQCQLACPPTSGRCYSVGEVIVRGYSFVGEVITLSRDP